jgi:hypothetical protein
MKSFTVVHVLLLLLLLLVYQCAKAQDYVLTTKGDSISAEIKSWGSGSTSKIMVTKADKSKEVFNLFQVKSYSVKGDIFYPIKFGGQYQFMKLIKKGYLSLFVFQREGQFDYAGQYLYKMDGKGMEVPNLNFKKGMAHFLSDCSDISEKAAKGDYRKNDLLTLVDDYNNCIQSKSNVMTPAPVVDVKAEAKTKTWHILLEKIEAHQDFDGKADAIEMVKEIKNKIQRNEKVPNFLTSGLKATLTPADLTESLNAALNDLNPTE